MKKKLVASILLCFTIWMLWGNLTIKITHFTVSSNKISMDFKNYTIVVLSDLHNVIFGNENSKIVELVKDENPDIIVFTGDVVDSYRTDVNIALSLMDRLINIAPCYYVTGNNEPYIGDDYNLLENGMVDMGVNVLHNKTVHLKKNGKEIQLAGIDDPDYSTFSYSVESVIIESRIDELELSDDYAILLSHRPEVFETYVEKGIDLVLSGHAHGGQFRLPFIGGLFAPDQGFLPKYDAGMYSKDNTTMIVSRGIGNSIFPIRFNNRPEIVVVELKPIP